MSDILVVRTVADLREAIAEKRKEGKTIALTPTMGNLHIGHISLTKTARDHADVVCATIFVNPKQFGENEDFGSYPRTFENDKKLLADAGVEILYAPTVDVMYPDGFATNVSVTTISQGLCGDDRPGHFDGVCTVVTKLLLQALPDVAVFGEKDFQQLMVIKQFTRDLDIPVKIIGSPTLREDDGLAMSSRNGYLSSDERQVAPAMQQIMQETVKLARDADSFFEILETAKAEIIEAGFNSVDYLEIREERDLTPANKPSGQAQRLFAAAHLGKARLIDNIPLV
ncbi:pantoate--beta-alanine ligase [Curvivirga aplysinae]|uniref:pantoate--beta-alanine ligase n=1 Tax=Curvivirga aplysinae TaxID=2529852 RepID=UPI0012BCF210|nr:pantoate--beta-alanine ligase [Curvivirga aplysinae]MTI11449.1 pantoate--beta-alanine ligase [Curvivirga aplysinae]